MSMIHHVVTRGIRRIIRILCRVDGIQLERVPWKGPLIGVLNHVNFLDVPLIYSHLEPRPITGFAKIETWDNPILRRLFDLWDAIPMTRGAFDKKAFRMGLEALKQGKILGIAPEGTRSGHGCLQRGNAGMVLLALLSRAPLQPVVYWGGEQFWENIHSLRRTDVHIAVGHPFFIDTMGKKVTREIRQEITDEIMFQLAALLPPAYRGVYENLSQATEKYLVFKSPSTSNLLLSTVS